MNTGHERRSRSNWAIISAALAALALTLTACSGETTSGDGTDEEQGYEYDAPQEDIDAAVEELEPVTITYQIPATSQQSPQANLGTHYKEAVEERSNGKITVELAWNQSIASYEDLHNALADGRVDMAFTLPSYEPAEFPAFTALNDLLGGDPEPPLTGELVTNLAAAEISWQSPEILEEYEQIGVTPFVPVMASASYYSICSDEATELEDWDGLQVRVGSPAALDLVSHLGGSPVSIAGVEAYEALQRGTIDCTLGVLSDAAQGGFFEVAPHLGYPTTTSFPRVAGAILTGSGVDELPVAYQQILFDSFDAYFDGSMKANGKDEAIAQVNELGGSVVEVSTELQEEIQRFTELQREEVVESGILGEDIVDRLQASREKWTDRVAELGYEDGGTLADFDDWHDPDADYRPLAQELFQEVMLEHRPGS